MNPIVIRILASLAAGFLLGLERQLHRQPAGLKTHILICVGSTLLMLCSLMISGHLTLAGAVPAPGTAFLGDPARIAAQVVSGIGFLGGGAIIRQGFNIKGLTTAATIWVSAAVGLALGLGAYAAAGITLVSVIVTLVVMERFEEVFFPARNIKTLFLVYDDPYFDYDRLAHALDRLRIASDSMDVYKNMASDRIKIALRVHMPARTDVRTLFEALKEVGPLVKMDLTSNEKPNR